MAFIAFNIQEMIIRLILGIYIIGFVCVFLDLAHDIDERSNVGYGYALMFVLSQKESYRYALMSWYYLYFMTK